MVSAYAELAPVSEGRLPDVDLVINVFERTYRTVLGAGFIDRIKKDNLFPFRNTIVLLNNISDMTAARRMAEDRIRDGEMTAVFQVGDLLEQALAVTGLTRHELGTIPYYTNWALAALVAPGSDYMVHWDAEVSMVAPYNWVEPSLRLMLTDSRVAIANPLWSSGAFAAEERDRKGSFVFSYGFSDQVYLLDKREFRRPIYRRWVPISFRYPLAHISPYFEQMVDAYLRTSGRYRATLIEAMYTHPVAEGESYPRGFRANARNLLRRALVAIFRRLPGRHPYFHD